MLLTPQPVALLVAGKVLAHWLVSGVPLVLMAPLLGLQFDLSWEALQTLIVSLLLGTPTLSLIGAIGAALGLALGGYVPMVEMQFGDFITCGFNQIVNNLAKTHWRWGERISVVLRVPVGGGVGAGPWSRAPGRSPPTTASSPASWASPRGR